MDPNADTVELAWHKCQQAGFPKTRESIAQCVPPEKHRQRKKGVLNSNQYEILA
jgi:hypothetical protein